MRPIRDVDSCFCLCFRRSRVGGRTNATRPLHGLIPSLSPRSGRNPALATQIQARYAFKPRGRALLVPIRAGRKLPHAFAAVLQLWHYRWTTEFGEENPPC